MRFCIFPFLLSLFVLTSCHRDNNDVVPVEQKRRTVIVYMIAENSLGYSFCSADLDEMIAGCTDIPEDCNFVAYVDALTEPCVYTFSAKEGKQTWKVCREQDSCDSLVFRNTLAEMVRAFPAEHYSLVLWSHGSGWIPPKRKTIGIDNNINTTENKGTELEIPTMRRMLEQVGVYWDYIFFDACFMQCVEVDYELRNVCAHVVGSPAEIPGNGAPYNSIMALLFADEDAAQSLAEVYFHSYEDSDGLIISVSESGEMDALAATMRPLVWDIYAGQQEYSMSGVQGYCPFTGDKVEYFDMGSVMHRFLPTDEAYSAYLEAVGRAYPLRMSTSHWLSMFFSGYRGVVHDAEHISAVSMFVPMQKYADFGFNQSFHGYQWYTAAGWAETGW